MNNTTNGVDGTNTADTNGTTEHKPLDREAIKKLLSAYDQADTDLTKAKNMVDKKLNARSAIAKQLYDMVGNSKFSYNGSVVSVSHKGDTYFFRGPKQSDILDLT